MDIVCIRRTCIAWTYKALIKSALWKFPYTNSCRTSSPYTKDITFRKNDEILRWPLRSECIWHTTSLCIHVQYTYNIVWVYDFWNIYSKCYFSMSACHDKVHKVSLYFFNWRLCNYKLCCFDLYSKNYFLGARGKTTWKLWEEASPCTEHWTW